MTSKEPTDEQIQQAIDDALEKYPSFHTWDILPEIDMSLYRVVDAYIDKAVEQGRLIGIPEHIGTLYTTPAGLQELIADASKHVRGMAEQLKRAEIRLHLLQSHMPEVKQG
jgi:hypothetical protein